MEELSRCLDLPPSPNQLTLLDAISLDCYMTNSILSSKSDLPRYMLRRIMLLDTSSRKLPTITQVEAPGNLNSNSISFLDEEEDDDLIHPMDIFLYLFLISTPIFRQTIVNQLAKCQLSLPLITHDSNKNETTLNLFAFETLFLNRYVDGNDTRCFSVVKEPLPIVSFIRIGNCKKSQKSELLNIILNIRHEYFSFRNSHGSTSKRFLLDGTVEIAWYLPKFKENTNINHHFILLNLRGDSILFDKQCTFIGEISTLVYVFVSLSKLTPETCQQLENIQNAFKSKVIFIVYKGSKGKAEVTANILNDKNNILPLRKNNPSEDSGRISESISHWLNLTNIPPISLSQCVNLASKIGIVCDFNKNDIALKQQCIESICKDFPQNTPDDNNPRPLADIKDKLLPLQRYFKSWSDSNRELQLLVSDRTRNVEEYIASAKGKQEKARSSQIQELSKPSNFVCGIMNECHKHFSDKHEIHLFFELLKDNLNTISRKFLPILYNQYKRWITESYSLNTGSMGIAERDAKQQKAKSCLIEAAEGITRSSLGIEHVFRELGQIYEAVITSSDAKLKTTVKSKLKFRPTLLPDIAACLILHGHSFEIVNGDDNHVPLTWVSDVLTKLSEIVGTDKKLFVVSVLGIQSSGKSTLLNTMFGINFPVSSGRCTRGLFLQMIPITEKLRTKVGYDFLLLLDTEGLRAPELSGGLSYKRDNEMATFTVGLADLALINIKGESHSEVQDILQITIIAFMRMKLTLKKPKCIFVHQNVGDIQARTNLMIARRNLIDTLNEMTLCAAQQENKELQFSQFCDVIEFNPEEDVFYFPSLFEGEPPMTSIAPGYIEKAQELKTKIIENNASQDTHFQSVKGWRKKLSNLWNSVLKENFVFSYRNILEVNARIELDGAMCCWHSNFIQAMAAVKSEFINKLYNVEFEILQVTLQDINTDLIRIVQEYSESDELIDYFFVKHEKKAIFEQWKFNTEQYFECCKKKELDRIRKDCETICNVEKQKQVIDDKFSISRKELFVEVRRLFDTHNDKTSFDTPGSFESLFDTFWKDWKSSFHCVPIESTDISNDLQQVLFEYSQLKQLDVFRTKQPLILEKSKFKSVGKDEFDEIYTILSIPQAEEHSYYTIADYQRSRILWGKVWKFLGRSNNENSNANQQKLQSILNEHTKEIDDIIRKFPKNASYSIEYFYFIIDKCINLITEHNTSEKKTNARQAIIFTNHYIFDFTFYQCCRAIKSFEELQESFIEQSSLEFKLESLESISRELFFQLCSGIQSENLCANKLSSIILSGIRKYLEDTVLQLLQSLFLHDPEHGTIYSNRGSLHLCILKDLAKKKDFNDYISYINSPFTYINSFIQNNVLEYSQKETVITNILFNINQSTHELKTQCVDTAHSVSQNMDSWNEWKQQFHKSIIKFVRSVKLRDLDILDIYIVKNYKQFSDLFAQTLEDSIRAFDWREWLSEVLTLDLLNEIQEQIVISLIECKSLCPFCQEPCQLSAGEHEHYCGTFHRPQGLSGWRYIQSRKIVVEECTTCIRCDYKFRYKDKFYNYSDYRTVNEYFNSWRILGDDSIGSKYWQWVLYTFQKEFVAHYEILGNEKIDITWSNLTEEEIIDDIEKHYQNFIFKNF